MNSSHTDTARFDIVSKGMDSVKEPEDILRILSQQPNENKQTNPLRTSKTHGSHIMVTTGQILIIASERLLSYRPLWCEIDFNFVKLDNIKNKTWFEIISSRKFISDVKESIGSFKDYVLKMRG